MTVLPSGTVTFLFTDIEGSTELLKQLGEAYAMLLGEQREILRACLTKWNGKEVDTQGDAFFYSFVRATEAVSAAVEAQRAIASHDWPEGVEVRIRMGLHTGEPSTWEEGYVGMDVHRAARIAHVGHGGQVLLSETTAPLVRDELPDGVSLLNLGRHRLKDMRRPERIHQLAIEGLPAEFPPLKSLEALPPEVPIEMGPVKLPAFLEQMEEAPAPVFVGRERELEQLDGFLQKAQDGRGGLAFVIGGPGRGKTALLEAFSRRASEARADLLVVWGECSAYTGVGDPYLPFRRAMGMLTGDLESRWAAGRISCREATRLWEAMPSVTREVVEVGPDLIDVFVAGRGVLSRLRSAVEGSASWIERLAMLADRERPSPGELEQRNLFEQVEVVLAEIAERNPLLLVLDDLQWADGASINLLFHLGRRLAGRRVLIVGAYRPEEIALDRGGEPHPLKPVLSEFKRQYGEAWIDLGTVKDEEGRSFVEGYLDSEPNRLSEDFRKALFMQTGGHPLFTVELLQDLQERGDLILDEEGRWVEGRELDWSILPARVEGVIEERIGRLEEPLRETLSIASVEGVDFTAQVVARVQQVGERKLIKRLSRELEKKHRLVRSKDEARVGEHYLYRYRFTHLLFQRFLYNDLSAAERRTMHGEVARVLEELYAGERDAITVQLANHYTEAGEADKAIEYLQGAGDRARMVFAHEEAIQFYERALAFEKEKGYDDQAARTLMKLGLTFHNSFKFQQAHHAYEEGFIFWRQAGEKESTELPLAPHALRIPMGSDPKTLDPAMAGDIDSGIIIDQLISGLVEHTPELDVVPDIARTWEVSEGGKKYVFHLREDVVWSDGTQVKAGDFEYAWKRALEPILESPNASLLYAIRGASAFHQGEISDPDLVGVRASDEVTLVVELERPTGFFLHLLASSIARPVPRHLVETHGEAWTDIGNIHTNGPFQLETWKHGDRMVLTINPKYHGRLRGNVQQVRLFFLPHMQWRERLEMYEADGLDTLNISSMTPVEMHRARQKYAKEYLLLPGLWTWTLIFDVSRPPFEDPRVRRAFVLATDRERLANVVLRGHHFPASGGFVPPEMPGHSPGIGLAFNPKRAQLYLAEAGYPHGCSFPRIESRAPSLPIGIPVCESLLMQWREVLGVDLSWKFVHWQEISNKMNEELPHMFLLGWRADYPDPDTFLRASFPLEKSAWRDETYDRLVEQAGKITDQEERLKLYRQAEKILIEEAPIMPLAYARWHMLFKPWVRQFPTSPLKWWYWKDVIIEPH